MSYKSVIDSFNVVSNPKYQPASDGTTYCNIFAQDVMNAMGEKLPSGNCRTMLNALENGYSNWREVSAVNAQSRANAGFGTIGITYDHVVVIYPHGNTAQSVSDLYMSMAGYKCFNNARITLAWTADRLSEVKFYSYFTSANGVPFTCDTHSTVGIQRGNKYMARVTCTQRPDVAAGTGGIVNIVLSSQSGNNYYFSFTGVKVGSTGIYINGSSSAVFICNVVDATFTCDTHTTVTIARGNKYQAKITCSVPPTVVAGTGGIVTISLASKSGNDYYYVFNGVNVGSTGIYINNSPSAVFICKVV